MQPLVYFRDLGLIDYKEAWDFQETIFNNTIQEKIQIRNGDNSLQTKNYLLFCEHPHVFTLGKSGS
jgi:lipoyl(octanoyl) transferase